MEITGRLTADAAVRKTTGNKELVAFTLVVNDYYKAKDGERKEVSEFFSCSYWLSTKIADSLQKSSIVTVTGRVYLNEYEGKDGKHYASLGFHANGIKIIATPRKNGDTQQAAKTEPAPAGTPEIKSDLPF